MPGFDGTGPRGEGPFTGRSEGYCVMRLPKPGTGEAVAGYAGTQGTPIGPRPLSTWQPQGRLLATRPFLGIWPRGNWRRAWRVGRGRRPHLGARRVRRR